MKRLAMCSVLLMVAAMSIAQLSGTLSMTYDGKTKGWFKTFATPIGKIVRPLGLREDVSVNTFIGTGRGKIAGFSASKTFQLAQNVSADVALGVTVNKQAFRGWAVSFGLTWRL